MHLDENHTNKLAYGLKQLNPTTKSPQLTLTTHQNTKKNITQQ